MQERPILFNGEMVRAVLDGRKTQTRRVIKGVADSESWTNYLAYELGPHNAIGSTPYRDILMQKCPYGVPGDRLWVRETFGIWSDDYPSICYAADPSVGHRVIFDGDWLEYCERWLKTCGPNMKRPSIHMPRWASRISLEVLDVRVERIDEISAADAIAEGIMPEANYMSIDCETPSPVDKFQRLWDRINEKRGYGWDVNPWVWVVEFRVVKP